MSILDSKPAELGCVAPDRSSGELRALAEGLATQRPQLERMAARFALLAGETRLRILTLLAAAGELCVCDLASILQMTPAAVSQHLSRLRSGGMVASRRDGMTIFYRLLEPVGGNGVELPEICPQRRAHRSSS